MRILIFVISLFFSFNSIGQDVSICNWKSDKKAAVVLTFDDWLDCHEKLVVPMLVDKSIPATFFITLNNVKQKAAGDSILKFAQENGLEIANHTISHPDLTSIKFKEAAREIFTTREFIRSHIPGAKSLTFAYPMGTKNPEIINYVKKNHIGARGVSSASEGDIKYDFVISPDDYYRIKTVRVWRVLSRNKMGKWIDFAKEGGGLLTFMIHSVYNDSIPKGWDAMPDKFLNDVCDTLLSHKDEVWLTTFEDAIQYHKEKSSTLLKIHSQKELKVVFSLTCTLDKNKFDEKLTIKINLKGRTVKSIFQGKENISHTIDGNYMLFDINPFGKKVTVKFEKSIH